MFSYYEPVWKFREKGAEDGPSAGGPKPPEFHTDTRPGLGWTKETTHADHDSTSQHQLKVRSYTNSAGVQEHQVQIKHPGVMVSDHSAGDPVTSTTIWVEPHGSTSCHEDSASRCLRNVSVKPASPELRSLIASHHDNHAWMPLLSKIQDEYEGTPIAEAAQRHAMYRMGYGERAKGMGDAPQSPHYWAALARAGVPHTPERAAEWHAGGHETRAVKAAGKSPAAYAKVINEAPHIFPGGNPSHVPYKPTVSKATKLARHEAIDLTPEHNAEPEGGHDETTAPRPTQGDLFAGVADEPPPSAKPAGRKRGKPKPPPIAHDPAFEAQGHPQPVSRASTGHEGGDDSPAFVGPHRLRSGLVELPPSDEPEAPRAGWTVKHTKYDTQRETVHTSPDGRHELKVVMTRTPFGAKHTVWFSRKVEGEPSAGTLAGLTVHRHRVARAHGHPRQEGREVGVASHELQALLAGHHDHPDWKPLTQRLMGEFPHVLGPAIFEHLQARGLRGKGAGDGWHTQTVIHDDGRVADLRTEHATFADGRFQRREKSLTVRSVGREGGVCRTVAFASRSGPAAGRTVLRVGADGRAVVTHTPRGRAGVVGAVSPPSGELLAAIDRHHHTQAWEPLVDTLAAEYGGHPHLGAAVDAHTAARRSRIRSTA